MNAHTQRTGLWPTGIFFFLSPGTTNCYPGKFLSSLAIPQRCTAKITRSGQLDKGHNQDSLDRGTWVSGRLSPGSFLGMRHAHGRGCLFSITASPHNPSLSSSAPLTPTVNCQTVWGTWTHEWTPASLQGSLNHTSATSLHLMALSLSPSTASIPKYKLSSSFLP